MTNISRANTQIIQLFTQLDNHDSQLKMIAGEMFHNSTAEEAEKTKQLLKSLVKSRYESNLKLIDSIIARDVNK